MLNKNPSTRIIAYYPAFARALGSIPAAIYYSQLCYWSVRGKRWDGYIYKSKPDFQAETALSFDQQDRARKLLVDRGYLLVKKTMANGHPTLHFKPILSIQAIIEKPEISSSGNSVVHDRVSQDSITEIIKDDNSDIAFSPLTSKKKIIKSATYAKNEASIASAVKDGIFNKPEYQLPAGGPYDWRYILNGGNGLTPERSIIASYWREKDAYVRLKRDFYFDFTFRSRDMADVVIARDLKIARQLANCIEIKDLKLLIEFADDAAWSEKKGCYWMEWKLATLLNYVEKLNDKK